MPTLSAAALSPEEATAPTIGPSQEQVAMALDGLYAAVASGDTSQLYQVMLPDAVDNFPLSTAQEVGAVSVTVSDVVITQDGVDGPGTTQAEATVTYTQPDGDTQVERHVFRLAAYDSGVIVTQTSLKYLSKAMSPPQSDLADLPKAGKSPEGLCQLDSGVGDVVACAAPECQADTCEPIPAGVAICYREKTDLRYPCPVFSSKEPSPPN
ncbi:MAG: hypothetical protein QG597_1439 [Actinomycetota bacterium]|nr:hypothetical protein [Actinomycetota bacterium]